jgi:hypothetical protein
LYPTPDHLTLRPLIQGFQRPVLRRGDLRRADYAQAQRDLVFAHARVTETGGAPRIGGVAAERHPVGFGNLGCLVFMDESAESVATVDGRSSCVRLGWVAAVRRKKVERAVWPVLVVVATVDAEHLLEVPAPEDKDPVEAVGAERAYPTFGVGIRVRRLDRSADHLDALGAEDLVEGVRELRVAVVHEEPKGVVVAELHDEVARLLCHPTLVGVRGRGDVLDPTRRKRDEEQHVDPLQERGFDRKEVAGEHACRLRA